MIMVSGLGSVEMVDVIVVFLIDSSSITVVYLLKQRRFNDTFAFTFLVPTTFDEPPAAFSREYNITFVEGSSRRRPGSRPISIAEILF